MFPGLGRQDDRRGGTTPFAKMTKSIADVEMMAHGGTVLEIEDAIGKWARGSRARSMPAASPRETEMRHVRARRPATSG